MRRGFGLIWLGATAVVSAITGFLGYQAGLAAGLAAKVPAGAVPYYYAPHFFGFGLLPFLFLLLVLFLVFRGSRRWGPGVWGPGGWAGGGWGPGPGGPNRVPGAPQAPADDPLQDWPQRPGEQPAPGRKQE